MTTTTKKDAQTNEQNNMELYDIWRKVPETAVRKITGGDLAKAGLSDIKPMWRIEELTRQLGPCGFGWRYDITRQWSEALPNGDVFVFCNINLYIFRNNKWSEAIPGTGGSRIAEKGKAYLRTTDEGYKMALTDAISVSCKALGMAADIYMGKESTKYTKGDAPEQEEDEQLTAAIQEINSAKSSQTLQSIYDNYPMYQHNNNFVNALNNRNQQLLKS
jgi:hypothetical protein